MIRLDETQTSRTALEDVKHIKHKISETVFETLFPHSFALAFLKLFINNILSQVIVFSDSL